MIAILGLLLLVVASLLAAAGIASNSGTAHPLGEDFTIAGVHLSGLSSGQLFTYGILVGGAGMLGVSMLLGSFSRRMASRRSRRALKGSQRETEALRLDHERLRQQLDGERADRDGATAAIPTDPAMAVGNGRTSTVMPPLENTEPVDQRAVDNGTEGAALTDRPSLLHRIGHRAGQRP